MSEELFRNKLIISSPTSISLGHITWFALDTKLVGRVKALLEERDNLQSKIDKAIELKHNWQNIKENATIVFDNNSLIEFMNNLEKILKEDK